MVEPHGKTGPVTQCHSHQINILRRCSKYRRCTENSGKRRTAVDLGKRPWHFIWSATKRSSDESFDKFPSTSCVTKKEIQRAQTVYRQGHMLITSLISNSPFECYFIPHTIMLGYHVMITVGRFYLLCWTFTITPHYFSYHPFRWVIHEPLQAKHKLITYFSLRLQNKSPLLPTYLHRPHFSINDPSFQMEFNRSRIFKLSTTPTLIGFSH
ncbi:hypothetical protein AVEN_38181-1 [Araneus ventricosus]|uniref:Uncharacterized protein n=1 Tax=Araneus ventricosus TaxID=182803 RepID=A0A4Y2JFF3_ARAVE|nr:hypothetical protein AVEN_38181-1 [Araneus ventricosus]